MKHEQLWEVMLLLCTSDHSKPILMPGNLNRALRDLPGPTDSSPRPTYAQVYIREEFLLFSVLVAFAVLSAVSVSMVTCDPMIP